MAIAAANLVEVERVVTLAERAFASLSQTVTPENLPLQQLMSSAQQWGAVQGLSAAQSQAMAMMLAAKQVAMAASVMAFDDVFRFTAVVHAALSRFGGTTRDNIERQTHRQFQLRAATPTTGPQP